MERCIRRGAFGPGSVRADTPIFNLHFNCQLKFLKPSQFVLSYLIYKQLIFNANPYYCIIGI